MVLKVFTIVFLAGMGLGNLWIASDLTFKSISNTVNGHASDKWPSVIGVIESSNIVATNKAYKPEIKYRYQVAGHFYSGDSIEFSVFGYERIEALKLTGKFPAGNTVLIYYKPSEPIISTLVTGAKVSSYVAALASVFWLLVSLIILLSIFNVLETPAGEFKQGYKDAIAKRFRLK